MRLLIILLTSLSSICNGQEYNTPLGKAKINKDINIRGEFGWNKSWFASAGISYLYNNVNSHSPMSVVTYAAFEVDYAGYHSPAVFYAYKTGVEFGGNGGGMGVELRMYDDFSGRHHLVFTPKIGIVLLGYANLLYGYNVFKNKNNIFGIGHSQISLSVNIGRKLLHNSIAPSH